MNFAPVCNHDLPLPPRTTLADALDRYGANGYSSNLKKQDFGYRAHGLTPRWYERSQQRAGKVDELRELIRQQAADAANDVAVSINVPHVDAMREIIFANADAYADRRHAEQKLADRMKLAAAELEREGVLARPLVESAERMMLCRCGGSIGHKEGEGGHLVAWDFKCGDSRLCPDEAREHVRWEARRYVERIAAWRQARPGRRVFYAVFTTPNADDLAEGVKHIFASWRDFLDAERPCTGLDREAYGHSPRRKTVKVWQPGNQRRENTERKVNKKTGRRPSTYDGPGIHGALVQLEAPLSARGDWNIHLNALLLVEGGFDYELARATWGYNVELREVRGDVAELTASMLELIKYAARHVGEKSQAKADAGDSLAPPMVEWSARRLWEFHQAAHGVRWLRSYGNLHGVKDPELKPATVVWIGRMTLTDAGAYWVDLIQGPNFSTSPPQIAQVPGYRVPNIRPPPELRHRGPP